MDSLRISSPWVRVGGTAVAGALAVTGCTQMASSHQPAAVTRPSASGSSLPSTAGSATAGGHGSPKASPSRPAPHRGPAEPAVVRAEAQVLARLSPRQMAGQRVIWSYTGLTPPASLVRAIKHGEVGGIIFFGDNVSSEPQIAGVVSQLEADNRSPGNPVHSPLLLMTDQEGGDGTLGIKRLPGAPYLSERQIGESANPAAGAIAAGSGAAANLHGVGMNVNLAPVLDVYRTPGDFIDALGRSYSFNPSVVSALGADFISAQQRGQVAATVKHFPGLGAAGAGLNTDQQPVTINESVSTLRNVDEPPYLAAVRAGVKLAMVSWAVYPHLDASRPAGLSTKIVQGELRGRVGFRGVTITDAIGAGALQAYGSWANRSALAARAGMDLVLCSGTIERGGTKCVNGLDSGYRDGQLGKPAFRLAVAKVLAMRAGL